MFLVADEVDLEFNSYRLGHPIPMGKRLEFSLRHIIQESATLLYIIIFFCKLFVKVVVGTW